MTPQQWAAVKELFASAAELSPDEQDRWLEEQSADTAVLEEVRRMLEHARTSDSDLLAGQVQLKAFTAAATQAVSLEAGQVLAGRYRIERLIGVGGMGEVYAADDLDLGDRIAVKVMRASLVENEEAIARFKREIQLARSVTHPNVCRIFDLQRHYEGGRVTTFLTMELVDGEPMQRFLARRGMLKEKEVLELLRPIAGALEMAHARRVIHRDFKPGNILLEKAADGRLRPVITDFGLAKTFTQETETSVSIVGTPAYMAPEQFEGGNPTPATDIYALGVLLFEMVTGRKPFTSESPIALALEKMRAQAPSPMDHNPKLRASWERVILKCLAANPEGRFQSVGEVLEELEEGFTSKGRLALTRRRRHSLAAGVGAAAALLTLGFAMWRMEYQPGEQAWSLYEQGLEARQIGLPVKAVALFQKAVARESGFQAAYARLAETWMELDQPLRAGKVMEQAMGRRPQWSRLSWKDRMLLRAAMEEVAGRGEGARKLHMELAQGAGVASRREALFGLARAHALMGDMGRAGEALRGLAKQDPCDAAALLAHGRALGAGRFDEARAELHRAGACFQEEGDLEGAAQSRQQLAELYLKRDRRWETVSYELMDVALMNVQATGNREQQIRMGALRSEQLLEFEEADPARSGLEEAVQLALREEVPYVAAEILQRRARFHFGRGTYFEADRYNRMAQSMAEGVQARETLARCHLLNAELFARMAEKGRAAESMQSAERLIQEMPGVELRRELARVRPMVAQR